GARLVQAAIDLHSLVELIRERRVVRVAGPRGRAERLERLVELRAGAVGVSGESERLSLVEVLGRGVLRLRRLRRILGSFGGRSRLGIPRGADASRRATGGEAQKERGNCRERSAL